MAEFIKLIFAAGAMLAYLNWGPDIKRDTSAEAKAWKQVSPQVQVTRK